MALFCFGVMRPTAIAMVGFSLIGADAAQVRTREVHAVYKISSQPMGSYHETQTRNGSGAVETTIETTMIFNRLGSKLEIKSRTTTNEGPQGEFLGVASDQSSSHQTSRTVARITRGAMSVSTSAGGKTYDRSIPLKGRLLGPEAARQLILDRLHRLGDALSYDTFSPELGAVVTITDRLVALGPIGIGRSAEQGMKLEQTLSAMPGKSIVWLDAKGWLVSQSTPSPLGDIEAVRTIGTTKTAAIGGVSLPKETFAKSVITANIRLPEERLIERIRLKITQRRPDLGWPDFSAPNQKVLSISRDTVILEVTRPKVTARPARPTRLTPELEPYLKPNALLQSDDPNVKAIVNKVVKPSDDSWLAVRALQKWTNDNMNFDLGIAIAPASEVAKNRGGTCFGYSMLLGSLIRAAGVPSRIRMGFVYAGGVWGGHAWVDALIGKDWIPVDGALYSPGPADAARFSCFTESLQENTVAHVGSLAQLFGNIDVKILDFKGTGAEVVVPPGARPSEIRGNTYSNPWLQFRVTKPAGYRFADHDLVWPQAMLVAMEGSRNRRIEIREVSASLPTGVNDRKIFTASGFKTPTVVVRADHRTAWYAASPGRAAMLVTGTGTRLFVVSTGPDAKNALAAVVSSMRCR